MIEIKDLKSGYGDGTMISAEKLELKCGQITTIIGKNGSGKSTLLKTIAGVLPHSGELRINGAEASHLMRSERARRVAYLPQLLPTANIDVQTLVEHGRYPWHGSMRRMSEADHGRVDEAIALTRLDGLRDRNISELSGGERQRAYLAMVIAQDAKMILLDEPAASLDISIQTEVYELLGELKRKGKGIVIASHDLPLSFSASDCIALVEEGKVSDSYPPEILSNNSERLYRATGAEIKKTEDRDALYAYSLRRAC